jgi:nucleoid-associated protein YgaU
MTRRDEAQSTHVRHRIVDGDTLQRLAAYYLKSEGQWREIFENNRHVLESPDLLPIGVELKIPVPKAAGG